MTLLGSISPDDKLDDAQIKILEEYAITFYGFGSYDSRYWFVGKESGGGSFPYVEKVLAAWQNRDRKELDDLAELHGCIDRLEYFRDPVVLQSTWRKLIMTLLVAEGKSPTTEEIRLFQRDLLGRTTYTPDSEKSNCLLELLPLPSKGTNRFEFNKWTDLSYLSNRETYSAHFAQTRADHIRTRINQHKPKVVVFYSNDYWYRQWWQYIAAVDLTPTPIGEKKILVGRTADTVFAVCNHPTSFGVTKDYFYRLGEVIAEMRSS